MSVTEQIAHMWVKGVIKQYPVKKVDMSLRRTFGVEGVCVIYTTRNDSELTYLIIMRDVTGEILVSDDDTYIKEQFQENLFNVEVVIKDVISHISTRDYLLKQVAEMLTEVNTNLQSKHSYSICYLFSALRC